MTHRTQPEVIVDITRYEVSVLPHDDINRSIFTIHVEARGHGLWAVTRYRDCLGTDGQWEWEPLPSNREDDWLATHRFDLDTALKLAREAAPHLICNGHTATDAYWRTHTGAAGDDT